MPTLAQEMTGVQDCNFNQMVLYQFNLPLGYILFMVNAIMSVVEEGISLVDAYECHVAVLLER